MASEFNDVLGKKTQDILNQTAQNVISNQDKSNKNQGSSEEKTYNFKFDELRMYYGLDYQVNENITIHIPTIGEIIDFGEQRMYSSITPFVGNPTSYRLQLWDIGVDWNKISDFELFVMLVQGLNVEDTCLIFGDTDFSKLKPYSKEETKEIVLYDPEQQLEIDEETYMHIREYVRLVFNQNPKVEKAKGKATKEAIIDEERMNLAIEKKKGNKNMGKSIYLPLISALLNHPGFKYKKDELREVNLVEFMDSVQRLQVYESTRALMSGMYSGMLDTSKMNLNKELNWLRDLHE